MCAPRPGDGGRCPRDSAETSAVDATLFRTIGLHGLLRTAGRRPRTAVRALCWLMVAVQAVQSARLFRRGPSGGAPTIALDALIVVNGLLNARKGLAIADGADRVAAVLDAAGYGFTACGARRPCRLRRCRSTVSALLRAYVALACGTVVLWLASPLLADTPRPPSVARSVGHAVSSADLLMDLYCNTAFNCFLVTACHALSAQFRTVSGACATIGHRGPPGVGGAARLGDDLVNAIHSQSNDDYDELIGCIVDMQKVMKKLDDFYAIVRPIVQVQIAINFGSIIALIFFTLHMYLMGWIIVSSIVMKYFFGFLSVIFELFMYCYAINLVETAKSTLNFGLYSSNWTEMDLKFKKAILLTMSMNSAHMQTINITPRWSINRELFAKIMILSYKILPTFINK